MTLSEPVILLKSWSVDCSLDPWVKPPSVCDDYYSCPEGATCYCIYEYGNYCFGWGCFPLESATCCNDHSSCCPQEFPVCDIDAGTCLLLI